ncbi:glycosyltransferase family 4 protein [Aquibacillus koreensis]|uniref:Glycosyltransferase family 4 protein n=1 Tax=Aquibacillus koreensis TaxID=279446 RepID=A0A9X3WHD2_9BACI|nr:glycosyltransferase family 4 protein [Aquibacillus koreensis]MCT2535122.1 glycosyltransferase family 4 protein [Aquibacillus koreensis]MDC3419765.1 glycosyltransferase family 4 protein [Aquibacillus koreensis]
MKILYMSWFSSGEGSKIHAQEFTHAMEQLDHEVITKDLSIKKHNPSPGSTHTRKEQAPSSNLKNYLKELKSLVMVFIRFIRLIGYINKYKPERLIYRYSIYDISGMLAAKLFRIPIIYEINGSIEYERDIANKFYIKRFVKTSEKYIFKHASLLLLVSEELKRYFGSKSYNMDHVLVVPNGVDIRKFNQPQPLPERLAQLKQAWSSKKVIGFMGSLKSWHGAERIIDLLPELIQKDQDVRYLIIGDGDQRGVINDKITQSKLQDYVYITGFQDYTIIPSLLDIMDIAVAPYQHIDFFHFSPLKVMEYMAKGKPVIAPALGQCKDLIAKDHGILLQENNQEALKHALLKLIMDPDQAMEMGKRGQRYIREHYTWEQNARRIEQALQENKRRVSNG